MSLVLLLPIGLAAGAALAVPLLLHLQRATESTRVDFAALRWLRARRRPRHRLRLREWLLLLLRLLLVALLALLLAQPAWIDRDARAARVFVAPGVSPVDVQTVIANLPGATVVRWLAPGFPALDALRSDAVGSAPGAEQASRAATATRPLASLLREADAGTPPGARLLVLVPPVMDGADAERPRLSHPVDWRVVSSALPPPTLQASPSTLAPPMLRVRFDGEPPEAVRYLRASALAWQATPGTSPAFDAAAIAAAAAAPALGDWMVWLGPGPAPQALQDWVRAGGRLLVASAPTRPDSASRAQPGLAVTDHTDSAHTDPAHTDPGNTNTSLADAKAAVAWRRSDGQVLARVRAVGRGREITLSVPLTTDALPELFDAGFPRVLRGLFEGATPAPTRAPASALRPRLGGSQFPPRPDALAPWLALLVAWVFACERLVATRRGREADA